MENKHALTQLSSVTICETISWLLSQRKRWLSVTIWQLIPRCADYLWSSDECFLLGNAICDHLVTTFSIQGKLWPSVTIWWLLPLKKLYLWPSSDYFLNTREALTICEHLVIASSREALIISDSSNSSFFTFTWINLIFNVWIKERVKKLFLTMRNKEFLSVCGPIGLYAGR